MSDEFRLDVKAIREHARASIGQGAVTAANRADVRELCELLNSALATELVCVLRYRRHYFMSANLGGIHGHAIREELLTHAQEELAHADRLAERIVQLGGEPNFDPQGMAERSHAEYVAGKDLQSMIREDLVAERVASEAYAEIIRHVGDKDPTTRRLLEAILEQEEEHADDLSDFVERLSQR